MASVAELAVQAIVTISGGGAAVAALNGYFSSRTTRAAVAKAQVETGKTEAEITGVGAGTAAVQVDTSLDLLREMRVDLTAAREEVKAARQEIRDARDDAKVARREAVEALTETFYLRGLLTAAGIPIHPEATEPDPI